VKVTGSEAIPFLIIIDINSVLRQRIAQVINIKGRKK
jgi:hypothetical protein